MGKFVINDSAWSSQGGGGKFVGKADPGFSSLIIESEQGDPITIKGVMKKPFDFSFTSEYGTMESIDIPAVTDVINAGMSLMAPASTIQGTGEMGSVYNSQKMWKKSGYLTLQAELRIIDYDGESGSPLDNASKLVSLCIPITYAGGGASNTAATVVSDLAKNAASKVGEGFTKIGVTAGANDSTVKNKYTAEDIGIYKDAPPTVKITWGKNMLSRSEMIVESVSLTPSKEIYEVVSGVYSPLYIDANITLSSRTILRGNSKDEIGFGTNAARVSTQTKEEEAKKEKEFKENNTFD